MIVIYHDVGGAHSSCTAANIHVNNLHMDKIPSREDLLNLPTFDKIEKKDQGHLIYVGQDEFGIKVYTLSRQYKPQLVIPAITDLYNIMNGNMEGLFLANTSPTVNNLMKIGGFTSRRLHWVGFGRPIVTTGTLKAYENIVTLVRGVKEEIRSCLRTD